MTRSELRNSLFAALGREDFDDATTQERAEVVRAVNAGLQMLWLAPSLRALRDRLSVTLVAAQAAYTLSVTAQEAYGPVRLADGRTLRRFESRGSADDYALEISGASSRTVADGEPWGYLIEHTRDAGAAGDPHKMTLRLVPAPNAAAVTALSPAQVDTVAECPRYTYEDLTDVALPVPEGYVETYLVPLARRELTRGHIFSRTELVRAYEADAERALGLLGIADDAAEATGDVGTETPTARGGKRRVQPSSGAGGSASGNGDSNR